MFKISAGLCGVSIRKKIPFALHIPQEEPEEETDGVFFFVYVSEVPLWITQLHWSACFGHSCKYLIHWIILNYSDNTCKLLFALHLPGLFQSSF